MLLINKEINFEIYRRKLLIKLILKYIEEKLLIKLILKYIKVEN